jgi:threonyl-tRNA synthetase
MREVYGLMGLTFKLRLSTRPEKFMGQIETWDRAEAKLREALDDFAKSEGGVPWELNPGDGAFYGPKIDIAICDCLNREWQCATIQLDFMQPQNFNLEYMTAEGAHQEEKEEKAAAPATAKVKAKAPQAVADSAQAGQASATGGDRESRKEKAKALTPGCARPVMIHRAMAGSIERFTAILTEHFAGKWPFWLSPRQILVIPVGKGFLRYAEEVQSIFKKQKMYVDVDSSANTLQKKIRTGQLSQYNFIFGQLPALHSMPWPANLL